MNRESVWLVRNLYNPYPSLYHVESTMNDKWMKIVHHDGLHAKWVHKEEVYYNYEDCVEACVKIYREKMKSLKESLKGDRYE